MKRPKSSRFLNLMIVAATVGVVAAPVAYDQTRAEVARWELAAAANAVVVDGTDPEKYYERAKSLVENPEKLRDYWLFRIKRALVLEPAKVPDELLQAIRFDPANAELTGYIAASLWEIGEFEAQIKVLEYGRSFFQSVSTSTLNQLAYARALTSLDLHAALEDINSALKVEPNNYAFRDTRSWVLFKMGKPLEAIEDIEFAISKLEEFEQGDWLTQLFRWSESWFPPKTSEMDAEAVLTREQAGEVLWGQGALYYHRAEILEALGRSDDADRDWKWLEEHHLPKNSLLY